MIKHHPGFDPKEQLIHVRGDGHSVYFLLLSEMKQTKLILFKQTKGQL
jgi:hypothetical protein